MPFAVGELLRVVEMVCAVVVTLLRAGLWLLGLLLLRKTCSIACPLVVTALTWLILSLYCLMMGLMMLSTVRLSTWAFTSPR